LTKIETEEMPDPSIEILKKIAKGLNVSVDDLIK
jgi:transcriptional regulator with XRE-family HTH domain